MSLENTEIHSEEKKKPKKITFEGRMFNLLLVVVIIGFPCLLFFLTWRFWGAGLK